MSTAAPVEGLVGRTAATLRMIKISHSLFALPFALSAVLLASEGWPDGTTLWWVIVAMVSARAAAMAFNRLVDADHDARNPRTATRELPSGQLSRGFVLGFILVSVAVFAVAAGALNPLCLLLSPVALAVILGYSYAKRFTSLCHVWLGVALGITPLAGWLAVQGTLDATLWTPASLAVAVLFWVAGFDLIYACQDVEFDREEGLHSLPARLGRRGALNLAVAFHIVTVAALVILARLAGLGTWYAMGVVAVAALLVVEHVLARPGAGTRLQVAFFHVNSAVGLVLLAAVAGEVLT